MRRVHLEVAKWLRGWVWGHGLPCPLAVFLFPTLLLSLTQPCFLFLTVSIHLWL